MKAWILPFTMILASCGSGRAPTAQVANIWAQPVDDAGTSAAVYMTINEACSGSDTLRSVRTKKPQQASLHASSVVDNALHMAPLASIPIRCGTSIPLKPMGAHVMLTGIPKKLGIGDRLPLTLMFEKAGDVDVVAEVTTLAVLENVDPMHMHGRSGGKGMPGMHMH